MSIIHTFVISLKEIHQFSLFSLPLSCSLFCLLEYIKLIMLWDNIYFVCSFLHFLFTPNIIISISSYNQHSQTLYGNHISLNTHIQRWFFLNLQPKYHFSQTNKWKRTKLHDQETTQRHRRSRSCCVPWMDRGTILRRATCVSNSQKLKVPHT